jgi:spore coat protein U-like protein
MADELFIADNYDSILPEVDAARSGTTVDDINYSNKSGKIWKLVHDGRVRAVKVKILFDGTDQTSRINTVIASAYVNELVFDVIGGSCTVSGAVTIPAGKKLTFKNNCKIIGAGSINFQSSIVDCSFHEQCFGTSLGVTNLGNADISVKWFGAKADFNALSLTITGSETDNQPIFKKALDSAAQATTSPYYNYRRKLYIPGCPPDKYYFLLNTWVIDASVEVHGDGWEQSILRFPPYKVGVHVVFPDFISYAFTGANLPRLRDFQVTAGYASGTGDGVSHGFLINSTSILTRVWASQFMGDGLHLEGNSPTSNVSMGAVSHCRGRNNAGSGLKLDGADAQVIHITGGDYSYNGRYGVWDSGFLGNKGDSIHTDGNGSYFDFNRGAVADFSVAKGYWVKYFVIKSVIQKVVHNGVRYHCILQHTSTPADEPGVGANWATYWASDGAGTYDNITYAFWEPFQEYRTTNVQPGFTTGWQTYYEIYQDLPAQTNPAGGGGVAWDGEYPSTMNVGFWRKWNANVAWISGGCYLFEDGNQQGNYDGCYWEHDQGSPKNNSASVIVGGFLANNGSLSGAIGNAQGYLAWEKFQSLGIKNRVGLRVNHDDADGMDMQLVNDVTPTRSIHQYWKPDGSYEVGLGGVPIMQIFAPGADNVYTARFNFATMPTQGAMTFPDGFYLARDKVYNRFKYFGSMLAPPTTGFWVEGAWGLNGTDDKIAISGWKCVQAGTPGVWVPFGKSELEITYAATINTDARKASTFIIYLAGNPTIAAPTFPEPGMRITYRLNQGISGSRTVTWNAIFRFAGGTAPTLSTGANYTDYIEFEYNSRDTRWDCIRTTIGLAP